MTFESEEDLIELNLEGTSEEADGYNDDVTLNVVSDTDMMNVQINYLAEETSEGSETDFDRTFTLSENDMEIGKLHRSEEHTSELQSRGHIVCRLLLEKKKNNVRSKNCASSRHS